VWGDQSPVSAIRLIQIAAQNSISNGFAMPLELNIDNYKALGNQTNTGYGSTLLKNQIPSLWASVTNVFTTEWDSNFVRVLITPGQVTNATGSFIGMSALFFGNGQAGDLLSQDQATLHGGESDDIFWVGDYDFYPTYDLTYNLDYSPSVGYTFTYVSVTTPQPQYYFSPYSALTANTGGSGQTAQIAYTPQQTTQASLFSAGMNLSFNSTPSAIQAEKNTGYFGPAGAGIKQGGTVVAEPVQVVSGDFYSDNVDMTLAGPMPLQLRRNYFSRNVADGEFGTGWKLSLMPRLVLTTNAANNALIYAAEPDGSVLAYRYQTNNLWTVMAADNPDLANFTSSGIGGKANLFNNTIQQNATNSAIYTLFGSDGSQRTYQVMTNFAITAGTNQLSRTRPYLTRWQDAAGNYYQFTYGTNSANNNFGQLYRAQSANGASLTFEYDYYGRIIQAISDDDRIVNYQYDSYGDLVSVTLPDNTQWQYGYDHYTFTTNSQTYTDSDHLLVSETKPNGREVANTYDSLRRVIVQQATVGANRQLITNAWFSYNNNCTTLTNGYVSGYTLMNDVFSNSYFYYYTNNLVTQIQEPLGLTNIQSWFSTSQSNQPGYYQQSLQFTVDVRGLTNAFLYDSNGNITNQIIYGDLTGNGVGGQSATNTSTYTTNNCPATAIDPSGNQLTFLYNDPSDAYHLTDLQFSSGGVGVATNHWLYTNVTTTVNMGGWFETNTSYGLCYQEILADSATNAWIYNGRGFPVQLTRYAATADVPNDSDPPVVTYFAFTPRGDLSSLTDASGRQVNMNYDEMGRLQWRDVFDQFSNVVSREKFYYNQNGDLEWYDGPRSNPDDYIWFSYDGAGRKVQEIHWRTQANPNGTGIQAVPGDNLYATTFYTFDHFGNLTSVTDQRGAFTTNSWDALGRLMQRRSFDVGSSTLLATEGFSYEVGGLVQTYTNALGGATTTRYTTTGQPEFRQNADGSTNGWTYYLDGRIQNEFQGNGADWQTTYNDANRTVTRIFYSAAGLPLATNVTVFDRRGNAVQWTDAAGNTFVNSFDGLDRLKVTAGPAIVTVTSQENPFTFVTTYVTNVLQQAVTNFYDAAGVAVTNINVLGEKTITSLDALGRTTSIQIYSASGSLVRERYFAYSADHNSVTITDGSGANAVSHTTYTDSDGHIVLSVGYPSANTTEFTLNQFDVAGNLISAQHDSSVNGAVTTWTTASYSFDGLNRMTSKIDRDNAPTAYAYDSMGDLTNRTMPGGSQWQASYNNAGRLLQEQNFGGGNPTRTTTYSYYSAGNAFAGLLQTKTDGRSTSCTFSYDDWLRPTNMAYSGSLPEQKLTTTWQYEPRGFITGVTEQFASTNTGPTTTISRSFDPYGQLASESVSAGSFSYGAGQSWDAAGRRSVLSIGNAGYSFSWQADGNLVGASDPTGGGGYSYDTTGLLTNRTVGVRSTTIMSRDGEGRPLSIATTINMASQLNESLMWSSDGLLATHTLVRGDLMTDSRSYAYANLSRRLTQEQLNLTPSTTWTNTMVYDNGIGGGPGVLTQMGQANSSSNEWSGAADAFSRVATETNSTSPFPAYGHINGQSILVSGWLDNQPVSISAVGTNAMQWRATMELAPGVHQLKVSALHPSGYFTAWATNSFTNNLAYQTTADSYDAAGNITNRVWKNPGGTVERTQSFSWDARGRLHQVVDLDTNNSGYIWSAVYDPFNQRLQTTTVLVSNNIASTAPSQTISSYFDPEARYLELGVSYGLQTVWKLYGPDLNGAYAGLNGAGGLDGVSPYLNTFNPVISDARGNILAEVTNGAVSWNPARPTGYGAVPGYRPAAFANGADMAQSSAWRGREVDITGYYNVGARTYDPVAGNWLSYDPWWNIGDPDGYTFCAIGDPVNYFDPDGEAPYAFNPADPSTWIIPKNGVWAGPAGNSLWYPPEGSSAFKLTGGQPVEWVSGTPNFRPFAQSIEINGITLPSTVKVAYSGDAGADRDLAVRTLANQYDLSQVEIKQALSANNLVIHHYYEGEMQIVPRGLNQLSHSGVASALRAGTIGVGGVLLRGGGVALKGIGIVGVLSDPVSLIAGPTTTMGDATISGQYDRAYGMVAYPEAFDITDVAWAHKFLNTGFQVGAMNDPANIQFYVNGLAMKSVQGGNVNAPPSSVSGATPVTNIGKKP
jgi:RHS repeat-associated protein